MHYRQRKDLTNLDISFLFKVCLMLGVEVRPGRMFRNIQERETHWLGNIKQNCIRKILDYIFCYWVGMGWIQILPDSEYKKYRILTLIIYYPYQQKEIN